ncbi:DNA polymerase III subunit gamma/tau [Ghiorsea bivora]|uniref:DNA polymerase III subunit gamma/tau n=1 Tax=Ghiorsea bivora TaxID=1485545 RepID=UPI0005703274|nr:DNA polymerase III subunit gamma/tau [Ghiorsea bivora]
MSYLVLARKWRPQRFADLTGQDVIVRTLKNALTSNHLAHAYLMTGIRGVGKTTISRLMAMAVNCTQVEDGEPCGTCDSCTSIAKGNNLDVQEMDAASHTGVDDIREILDGVRYPPVHLKIKVYIIDEAHMLSKSAFNALLKTLEEPPENVLFILATTESDKLPITVRSRCQRFDLRRLNVDEIADYLAYVLQEEGINTQEDALQVIARSADGSVRDALSLTERVLAFSSQDITLESVQQSLGLIGSEQTQQLAHAVLSGDAKQAVQSLRQSREVGVSPSHLLKSLSELLHEMMCCKLDASLMPQSMSSAAQTWVQQQADCWSEQALDMRYQVLIHGLRDLPLIDEQRGAEMIVMRLAHLNFISPPEKEMSAQDIAEKKTIKNVEPVKKREFTQKVALTATQETKQTPAPQHTEPATQNSLANSNTHQETEVSAPVSPPNSWEEAMQQYHQIKPGIAAMLEHVLCQRFDDDVLLLLDAHQQDAITNQDRQGFESWLKRKVIWGKRTNEDGESLLEQKKREANEYTRKLWQDAESDPHIQALKEALNCRLVNVRPPEMPSTEQNEVELPTEDD